MIWRNGMYILKDNNRLFNLNIPEGQKIQEKLTIN